MCGPSVNGSQILNSHRFETLPTYILPFNEVNCLVQWEGSVSTGDVSIFANRSLCRRRDVHLSHNS